MAQKQMASRLDSVVEALDDFGFDLKVEVDDDIPAENDVERGEQAVALKFKKVEPAEGNALPQIVFYSPAPGA